jgi:hypothetical protein
MRLCIFCFQPLIKSNSKNTKFNVIVHPECRKLIAHIRRLPKSQYSKVLYGADFDINSLPMERLQLIYSLAGGNYK